jgi:hypothetical protein
MATTYEPIATTTLGTAAATIDFTSIPATYTDLRLIVIARTISNEYPSMRINSDTGSNYSQTGLYGNGTSVGSWRETSQTKINYPFTWALQMDTTIAIMTQIDIFSYAGSTFKTMLIKPTGDLNGSGSSEAGVALWRSTSAITSLTLSSTSNFATGTTATLYGIKAA